MNLSFPNEGLDRYKSLSQRARISSESWGARELYCPRCPSNSLAALPGNTPVFDYRCPNCLSAFQLKSSVSAFRTKLTDGAYAQMQVAIHEGRAPNLFLLQYQLEPLSATALTFIPDFAFTLSALECRRPLAATARRAGWIGCNILLNCIPADARITVIHEKHVVPATQVRRSFRRLKPLASLKPEPRGWALDVLNVVHSINKTSFELSEVYAFEEHLSNLHPDNRHVRDKIRQQLQILRDLKFLEFHGNGRYELT